MRTKTFLVVGIDADTAGLAALQSPAAGSTLSLKTGHDDLDPSRLVTLTSTANFSGTNFTITGLDRWGNPTTEVLAGPNNNTVTSKGDYVDIISIIPDTTGAAAVAASGVLTAATIAANDTVTIGARTYTFKSSVSTTANEVKVGADLAGSLANLVAAINHAAGSGTVYGSLTTIDPNVSAVSDATTLTATDKTPGAAGNSVSTTAALTSGSWANTTLTGGSDAPTVSAGWPAGATTPWVACGMRMGVGHVSEALVSVHGTEGSPAGNVEITFDMFPQLAAPQIGIDQTTAIVLGTPQNARGQGVRFHLTSGAGTAVEVKFSRPGK